MGRGSPPPSGDPGSRGAVLERLILDTSVIVGVERTREGLDAVIDDDDVAIAAITAAELLAGVEPADAAHRRRRSRSVESIGGGAHDLLIAAAALARQRTVVTADARGFAELPGVGLRPLP